MQENNQVEISVKQKKRKNKKKDKNDTCKVIKQETNNEMSFTCVEPKTESSKITKESDLAEKKNLKKPKGKIVFDEESVTKYEAQTLIKERDSAENNTGVSTANKNQPVNKKKQRKKKRKMKEELFPDATVDNEEVSEKIVPKRKKQEMAPPNEIEDTAERQESDSDKPEGEKKQSIRAQKRAKHLKLLEGKRLKSELNMQQKCLNYLSQWKHDKSTWKFEKLKQVWLLQNMYDDAKIPNEFWDTTVKYFNSAKGKVMQVLLAEALKIIENSDKNDENSASVKYERARYLAQNLQE